MKAVEKKAKELVQHFSNYVHFDSPASHLYNSKACANICLEEMISRLELKKGMYPPVTYKQEMDKLQEIKTAINKL